MQELNFPKYQVRTRSNEGKIFIFDTIRKRYVALTPEEWVRQHLINYLITEKKYPSTLLSVEMPFKYVRLNKRSDVVVFNRNGKALMIAECKAPDVHITQAVFDQILIYNISVHATCLMVTNGMQHYCFTVPQEHTPISFLNAVPDYDMLQSMQSTV